MSLNTKRLVNAEGVTDHTALLPTKSKELVDFDSLTENERKVLELVYQNLEEATSKPYKYEKTTVKISYQGEVFTASGVRNIELGWKKNRPDETKEQLLPEFHEGEKIDINDVFIKKHQTERPDRFTDGKLLKEMEIAGKESVEKVDDWLRIGTPATRADTIEKLVSGGFVERAGEDGEPQVFVPTELAKSLCSVLPDSLKSATLTAEWKSKLSEVEKGNMEPELFMEQIRNYIRKTLSDATEEA
jgi:DNA topoisomerase-3